MPVTLKHVPNPKGTLRLIAPEQHRANLEICRGKSPLAMRLTETSSPTVTSEQIRIK